MRIRRWETWVVGWQGDRPVEERLGSHLFNLGARLRIAREPSMITRATLRGWNKLHPDEQLTQMRWEIRKAS